MSACNFSIPFNGNANEILEKTKKAVESQGGVFDGDGNGGTFNVSVFGNTVAGSYTMNGQMLDIQIDEKPFLVPCSAIEGFLGKQLA